MARLGSDLPRNEPEGRYSEASGESSLSLVSIRVHVGEAERADPLSLSEHRIPDAPSEDERPRETEPGYIHADAVQYQPFVQTQETQRSKDLRGPTEASEETQGPRKRDHRKPPQRAPGFGFIQDLISDLITSIV